MDESPQVKGFHIPVLTTRSPLHAIHSKENCKSFPDEGHLGVLFATHFYIDESLASSGFCSDSAVKPARGICFHGGVSLGAVRGA